MCERNRDNKWGFHHDHKIDKWIGITIQKKLLATKLLSFLCKHLLIKTGFRLLLSYFYGLRTNLPKYYKSTFMFIAPYEKKPVMRSK